MESLLVTLTLPFYLMIQDDLILQTALGVFFLALDVLRFQQYTSPYLPPAKVSQSLVAALLALDILQIWNGELWEVRCMWVLLQSASLLLEFLKGVQVYMRNL